MANMSRVLLVGTGRMGSLLKASIESDDSFELVGMVGIEDKNSLADGEAPDADVVIDFSHHEMVHLLDTYVRRTGASLVSGTTGLDDAELLMLRELGNVAAVVHSANYSLGIAVLRRLAQQAASTLRDWDIEIVECHHNRKADAPSGTALALREAVDPLKTAKLVTGREGMVGQRTAGEIGIHAIRGGTEAGTHSLLFFGNDEELSLTHRASSRQIFVAGALAAARQLVSCDAGFYTFDQLMFNE